MKSNWVVFCIAFFLAFSIGYVEARSRPSYTINGGSSIPSGTTFTPGATIGTNPAVNGCITLDGGGSNWTQLCPNGVTPLNTASPVQMGAIVSAAGISGTSFTGTTTTGQNFIIGNTTSAAAGTTLAATAAITANVLDSTDCVFGVGNNVGTLSWCVTYGGSQTQIAGDITTGASGDIASGRNLIANTLKAPVVHGAGTAAQAIESGSVTLAAGSGTVTFSTAFAATPKCTCGSIGGSALACSISTDHSASGFTMLGSGVGTPDVEWICIGTR